MRVLLHLRSDSLGQATVLSLHSSPLPARGSGEDHTFWHWFGRGSYILAMVWERIVHFGLGLGEDRAFWPWFVRGSYILALVWERIVRFGRDLGEDRAIWPLYETIGLFVHVGTFYEV